MTVGELREALAQHPDGCAVLVAGYEEGHEHIVRIRTAEVVHDPAAPIWRGDHVPVDELPEDELAQEDTSRADRFKAVLLEGRHNV